jgi:hypothetical protein
MIFIIELLNDIWAKGNGKKKYIFTIILLVITGFGYYVFARECKQNLRIARVEKKVKHLPKMQRQLTAICDKLGVPKETNRFSDEEEEY